MIKIGFSGSPRSRFSKASTLTRTIVGGSLQEAMLHNLFNDSRVWRDDKPERSSAEWYKPRQNHQCTNGERGETLDLPTVPVQQLKLLIKYSD